jgi:hypothetical protein
LRGAVVALLVMAVPGVAGQNQNAVGAVALSLQDELGIARPLHITRIIRIFGG